MRAHNSTDTKVATQGGGSKRLPDDGGHTGYSHGWRRGAYFDSAKGQAATARTCTNDGRSLWQWRVR